MRRVLEASVLGHARDIPDPKDYKTTMINNWIKRNGAENIPDGDNVRYKVIPNEMEEQKRKYEELTGQIERELISSRPKSPIGNCKIILTMICAFSFDNGQFLFI